MNLHRLKQIFFPLALIALGFAAVFGLSRSLEKSRAGLPADYPDDETIQGAKLKGFTLGFEGLLADWYWMKSLQYVGDKIINAKGDYSLDNLGSLDPRLLYPYLNNAADLDPNFISVYEYGATVLPAINEEQAIKLTGKGIVNNPGNWRLYHYLGYIYWRSGDYEKAADSYQKGSQIAGAPDFMKSMAARMTSEGGNRETARIIYRQMFDESQDTQSRENAALRLAELDSLDERETIQKVLDGFKLKNNRCANGWNEILPLLQNEKLPRGKDFRVNNSNNPVDPTDAPYLLDKESCTVKLDLEKTKLPQH